MLAFGDLERVAGLMRETAAVELLPRFRNLAQEDIRHKRPGDVVTVADVAAEQRLASGLAKILPGVPVVGEESVENDASLLELIGRPGESCWIVDPLDGTANFAAGRERFAIIVCLVHDAEAIGGWILDVPNDRMAVAGKGQGVRLQGESVPRLTVSRPPRGYIGFKMRKEFDRQLSPGQRSAVGSLTSLNCAGREYLEILAGNREFSLYRRTKPWDHAAGALMITEAGGIAVRFDGEPYRPAGGVEAGIIAAATPEVLREVRTVLEAVRLPLLAQRS
ncbi:inositol monophosphatase family protein [Enhydrobacter sp.]|jgi:fructose-1,6-bisphosphatase/inositol monophosphatase family enzyme|uniref:inositol monophosphatase family protein n=1 Tax=Enhydrobacter sp. TaxID=1894999 RepID=UPI00261BEA1C|nr:inositol monophosphatase family protein [Enhydrobacter sp.]WIM13904.1 MAG: Inositol-1-monophosphatase [Enhydrobacter sp.]